MPNLTKTQVPISELRRMLPIGANYFASSHGFMVSSKTAIFGRSVISNTPRQMVSLVTSGPQKGLTIWLTWNGVKASKNTDGSISLTSADGITFMTIYFSEQTAHQATKNQESM